MFGLISTDRTVVCEPAVFNGNIFLKTFLLSLTKFLRELLEDSLSLVIILVNN